MFFVQRLVTGHKRLKIIDRVRLRHTNRVTIIELQKKPLNVIALSQTISDNINRMITITSDFYVVIFSKLDFQIVITLRS